MTTDRCIHGIAHNTAQELPTSFQPCLSVPSTLAFSLLYYPLRPATRLAPSPSFARNTLLPPPSSPLPSAPSPSESLAPRGRGENERAHMYARIIRAAAPRSLIVHRNRNCVPASHDCGLPVLCPACPAHRPTRLLFVADSQPFHHSERSSTNRRLPSAMRKFRSIDKSHVCLYHVGRS